METFEEVTRLLRTNEVGRGALLETPFGKRRMLYADLTAALLASSKSSTVTRGRRCAVYRSVTTKLGVSNWKGMPSACARYA